MLDGVLCVCVSVTDFEDGFISPNSNDIIHLERPLTIAGMAILQETPVVA